MVLLVENSYVLEVGKVQKADGSAPWPPSSVDGNVELHNKSILCKEMYLLSLTSC